MVDQSILELKAKDTVPLDKVRNWSFANKHGASWETLEWRGRFAPW